ncbi:MAG: hypothetical protein KatS3mg031_0746 [Chitinophagales bacterium]|nr:MAG: hypothetical protein KatS3mg031_0746 [Chitinophagales bacterium]
MHFWRLLIPLLIAAVSFSGCRPDKNKKATFILDVKAMVGDSILVLGQTYLNDQQYKFSIEKLRLYVSHLVLVREDGSEYEVNDVAFLNFENNHSTPSMQGEEVSGTVEEGTYKAVRFAVGVDSARNFQDPGQYTRSHPLSIYNGMHWNWNTGYIFFMIEGRTDSVPHGNGTLDKAIVYHIGTQPLYRAVRFDQNFTIGGETTHRFRLKLDINRVFSSPGDTINPASEGVTQTMENFPLAERVADHFSEAFMPR